jgi:hypothetical protein
MPELQTQPAPETTASQVDQISSLLSGKNLPEKAGSAAAPEKDEGGAEKLTVSEPEGAAAEGVPSEPDHLDYGMRVPISGGEPVTLGELKDAYQGRQKSLLELQERENTVMLETERSKELLRYVSDLPPHIQEAAKAEAMQDNQREMEKLVRVLPEAGTKEGIIGLRKAVYSLAQEYGVSPDQVNRVRDATTIKMMFDFARLRASIKDAKANVRPIRGEQPKAHQTSVVVNKTQTLIDKAKRSRNAGDQQAAIQALLGSK